MTTKTIRYAYEESAENAIAEVQVTVGTVTVNGVGKYSTLRRQYQNHIDALVGKPISQLTPAEHAEADPALLALNGVLGRWAAIKVAIRSVKVVLAGSTEAVDADLAFLGWDDLEGVESIPADLFSALDIAAVQVNPHVFNRFIEDGVDPKERKVGVLS